MLLKEIEALRLMPQTPERQASIAQLEARATELRIEIYARLTPWQRVLVARHANRPCTLDYVERLFTEFTELHGDRRFADDTAIVTGLAAVSRRAGCDRRPPEGSRHEAEDLPELRLRQAGGLSQGAPRHEDGREVLAADPRLRGHAGRLSWHRVGGARRRRGDCAEPPGDVACSTCRSSCSICGEGGSGGALGIAVGDRDSDAGVHDLQRDSAGGLRRHPLARREAQGRGGRGAQESPPPTCWRWS